MKRMNVLTLEAGLKRCKVKTRLRTFINNGTDCAICGIKGVFFAYEYDNNCSYDPKDPKRGRHLNLYAKNEKGKEVLMTRDHIIPKSLGGSDSDHNSLTMCSRCNQSMDSGIKYCDLETRQIKLKWLIDRPSQDGWSCPVYW